MDLFEVKKFIANNSFLKDYKHLYKIEKGWSKDEKFYIETKNGKRYLLRISPVKYFEDKEKEFNIMKYVSKLKINMSKPVDIGICNDCKSVYTLLTWINGEALDQELITLSDNKQYEIGIKAGKILKKFHSISAPEGQQDWEQRMLKKFDYHLTEYKRCDIRIENDKKAIDYVQNNLHLLKNRPQVFHHGDFHVGNLIIDSNKRLGVIDFNRWDYGDPYEEFYKMMLFSRDLSIPFAKGQLDGYFNYKVPKNFFDILALYLADVILYSVVWALPFGEKDVNNMKRLANMILTDYSNFNRVVPKWFKY